MSQPISLARLSAIATILTVLAIFVVIHTQPLPAGQTKPVAGSGGGAAQPPVSAVHVTAAISPFVDGHTHFDADKPADSVRVAWNAMPRENASRIVLMPQPFAPDNAAKYDLESFLPAIKAHAEKFVLLGGGGTLNVMIQQAVKAGETTPELRKLFQARAERILREGAAGFGEMTAEHLSTPASSAYEYAPADHPLFLLLADISAPAWGAPIDLHMEAAPESIALPQGLASPPNPPQLHANIAAFERLLAHNPGARIIWAHLGADNTGYRTPELCRRLLHAHANLYMSIKIDPKAPGMNALLAGGKEDGKIDPEWLKLLQDFSDRFVIGSDQHYGSDSDPLTGSPRWEAVVRLFNQLPEDLRRKIGVENAARLYRTESPNHPGA